MARFAVSMDTERLDRMLTLAGVTPSQLAEDAGVGQATISRARAGRPLTRSVVAEDRDDFGVLPDQPCGGGVAFEVGGRGRIGHGTSAPSCRLRRSPSGARSDGRGVPETSLAKMVVSEGRLGGPDVGPIRLVPPSEAGAAGGNRTHQIHPYQECARILRASTARGACGKPEYDYILGPALNATPRSGAFAVTSPPRCGTAQED